MRDEESQGNELQALISLSKENVEEVSRYPFVNGSKEALQILARNGWGVHAVPSDQGASNWQLFIIQHPNEQHEQDI